ncbi:MULTISPECIES: hypothetical protein [unclassified Pseudomonas]|uniref:hypothetical protein n=1 Tax=unclassified Pseudomonas TaxID=196821 RepID=UPI000BC54DD0|nr:MULTISPECIES: hypothetical protein [unclassified Pseudomonas]PVZ19642.1 hypothetical protein F474_00231 [Pseudomonas sp. URIL14HWK12:I12]PVZ22773.1 hypothetical protein F470_03269 [Pseudomonas sp. URIL14HWK12:I10]PVZ37597.1 hypothetical protein F472_00231 [Pseudomonas sp. URIL14HWK12:I11]SNZ15219.1 hypothetical protein SAMN05660463_03025 [Pseudomonas sp. URIL14HWK12:I9]
MCTFACETRYVTPPAWYLPLSDALATTFAQGEVPVPERLSRAEIAAVLFLQHLPVLNDATPAPLQLERQFAGLLLKHTEQLQTVLATQFDRASFSRGLMLTAACGIGLMDQSGVDRRGYLLPDGTWDFNHGALYAERETPLRHLYPVADGRVVKVTDHQLRLLQTLKANPGESVEAQAHAGTGKTHLLSAIIEHLGERRCLFLADTESKLVPIRQRFPEAAASTFLAMAASCVERQLGWGFAPYRSRPDYGVSTAEVAQSLNLPELTPYTPAQVAAICRGTVIKFCASNHDVLGLAHIPKAYQWLAEPVRQRLVGLAQQMWAALFEPPQAGVTLPIRAMHWIKFMALSGANIPGDFSHVLIDEGHDLTPPLVQILDRGPQAVITLGDRYQNLAGFGTPHAAHIRHREMRLSLRAGTALQDLVNPLIDAYPGSLDMPFQGNHTRHTEVIGYPAQGIPEQPTLILVKDIWGLWDWVQRLASAEIHCQVVTAGPDELLSLVPDAARLFRSDVRSHRPDLARYRTWDQLHAAKAQEPSFLRVAQWLAGQRDHSHLRPWYSLITPARLTEAGGYRVALVRDVRNFEFDRLALSDDLYLGPTPQTERARAQRIALLYTAITRVRHCLYLPANHSELQRALVFGQA